MITRSPSRCDMYMKIRLQTQRLIMSSREDRKLARWSPSVDSQSQRHPSIQFLESALSVYVCRTNKEGKMGLGANGTTTEYRRPRHNPILEILGVVQLAAGGMQHHLQLRVMPAESPQSHHSSTASCICTWLARQPDPQYYQREESLLIYAQGTKRSRRTYTTGVTASGSLLPKKRPRLGPITSNRMAPPMRHSTRIHKDKENMMDNTLAQRSNIRTIDSHLNVHSHIFTENINDIRKLPTRRDSRLKRKSPSQGFEESSDSESPTKRVAHTPFDPEKTPRGLILGIPPPLTPSEPIPPPHSPRSEKSYASSTS
jgi:hypothetical protein